MVVLREEFSYLQTLSDILSLITIGSCLILKVPQISTLLRVKNANGINLVGLLLELTSYTIMFSYNYRNGYALLSYMEYPIILVQELVLVYLVIYYKGLVGVHSLIGASLYFFMAGGFLLGFLPREALMFLVPLCTPIGASSKVVQLFEILRSKNAESVSVLTWFISAFTNLTRIFTIYMDSADAALLLNFSVNVCLSSSIMFAAYFYKLNSKEKAS
ncbi:uncharacterized protein CBL_02697 [Carabus blaptoides fortunei]